MTGTIGRAVRQALLDSFRTILRLRRPRETEGREVRNLAYIAGTAAVVGVGSVSIAYASDMPSVQPFVDRLARDASVLNIVLLLLVIRAEWRDMRTNRRVFETMQSYGSALADVTIAIESLRETLKTTASAVDREGKL